VTLYRDGRIVEAVYWSAAPAIYRSAGADRVEVTGRLIWNKALVAGHYEINNPQRVTCR
jgi:hypothetical protein